MIRCSPEQGCADGIGIESNALLAAQTEPLIGNSLANKITGNADNDVLNGKGSADILKDGGAAGTFVFKTAIGPSKVDRIILPPSPTVLFGPRPTSWPVRAA